MKLGEALNLRSEIQRKIGEARNRASVSLAGQEGEDPPYNAEEEITDALGLADQLEALIVSINKTNLATVLPNGLSITEAIARRDALGAKHNTLAQLAQQAANAVGGHRYSLSEIKTVIFVDPKELRARADAVAQQRRELDGELQAANWTTELTTDEG